MEINIQNVENLHTGTIDANVKEYIQDLLKPMTEELVKLDARMRRLEFKFDNSMLRESRE